MLRPVVASLRPPGPSGHRPGCRGLEADAGHWRAHRRKGRAEWRSPVPTSRRAPTLRGTRRAERLEEIRMGRWNEGAKAVRELSPGGLPRLARGQSALGLRGLPGVSPAPTYRFSWSEARAASQPRIPRGCQGQGAGGTSRPRDRDSRQCHLLYPDLAASARSRDTAHTGLRVKCSSPPVQTSGETLANRRGPSPRPRLSEGAGAVAPLESHLLESAPPLRRDWP